VEVIEVPKRVSRIFTLIVVLLIAGLASARMPAEQTKTRHGGLSRVLVLDGSPVHNVGELQLHTGNWGGVGSWPGAGLPFSDAPSAQWPAGSGTEYLFAGGLWVGGIKNGIPAVSTAAFQMEFRPTDDPVDIVYRSTEGARGGNRLPAPNADDDRDGLIDEDPIDGRDNDNDGKIDEDFAAISTQMFSRWYTDNQPISQEIYPQHNPLHIMVRENSYQWDDEDFDDFVGFDYEITNTGTDVIEDVYVGVFLDGDVGDRHRDSYWEDDATVFVREEVRCTEHGPVSFDFAYTFDADGDQGSAPGYFGIVILDHPTDETGEYAPTRVGATTYANFSGNQSFEQGGDPTNDFERYELMSSETIERDAFIPRDYRMLVSVGPFMELLPGETLKFSMALVATPRGDFENVANAVIAYQGQWFDLDADPMTGISGRETPVPGPVDGIIIDPCRPGYDRPINWASRDPLWINTDCEQEAFFEEACTYGAADSLLYRTGSGGREYQVHWWLPGQEIPRPVVGADVKIVPRTLNLKSMGDGLRAHVTLPDGYAAGDVDESTLRLNGTMPGTIQSMPGDGKLIVRFSRKRLHEAMPRSGMMEMTVSGEVGGALFEGTDQVRVTGGDGPQLTSGATPAKMTLSHSPNPFNPSARIVFELPREADVTLEIFSADGRRVRELAAEAFPAGRHDISWHGRDDRGGAVASGIYFYRLRAGDETLTRKMVLVK
jgi:hypothetical protein